MKHKWFTTGAQGGEAKIDADVVNRLKDFKGVSKLKKAAMNMLVKMADQNSIEELRA